MPYYIDTNKHLYWLDTVDHEYALPNGVTPITDEQAQAIHDANAATQAAAIALLPNPVGFTQAIKSGLGGIVSVNALAVAYPLFFEAIATQQWEDVHTLIQDAKTKLVISADQYAAIKVAATTFNIPITLL